MHNEPWKRALPLLALALVGCGGDDAPPDATDITDAVFTELSADCADYVDSYTSSATDIQRSVDYTGSVLVGSSDSSCSLTTNAIPNHDFNDATGAFVTVVAEVDRTFSLPRNPSAAATTTPIGLDAFDAVMLNGVVVDLLSAGCFGVGDGMIGCDDLMTEWRFDPMHPGNSFGADANNAHTQPDGTYHYHGDPVAMYDDMPGSGGSPVIGFASDGFPIYGPYFYDSAMGTVREALSGYELLVGTRPSGPGGTYDGTYVDDWTFTDSGDLDECNGMMVNGQYGYYITSKYPWILGCFRGTPDPSFSKMP